MAKGEFSEYIEVFNKIDRETEIRNQIDQSFKEYDYLIQLKEFLTHLKIALNGLDQIITNMKLKTVDNKVLANAYSEAKFYYFSIFSTQLAFENYLYSGSKELKATEEFHSIIDTWKQRPDVRLVRAIRNRIQHGATLDGSLKTEETMKTAHQSESLLVLYVLDDVIWKKVVEKVDRNTKEFFDKSVNPKKDRLYFLVSEYDNSLQSLRRRIESRFVEIYAADMAERRTLFQELDEIEKWFKDEGWSQF